MDRRWIDSRYEIVVNGDDIYAVSHAYGKQRRLSVYERQGYRCVKMNNKTIGLHRLVAIGFIGPVPDGKVVNHIDGNKHNNSPDNLEYVTISENVKHAIMMGLRACCNPEKLAAYKDGRTRDRAAYKRDWYRKNREKILADQKRYQEKRKAAKLANQ